MSEYWKRAVEGWDESFIVKTELKDTKIQRTYGYENTKNMGMQIHLRHGGHVIEETQ